MPSPSTSHETSANELVGGSPLGSTDSQRKGCQQGSNPGPESWLQQTRYYISHVRVGIPTHRIPLAPELLHGVRVAELLCVAINGVSDVMIPRFATSILLPSRQFCSQAKTHRVIAASCLGFTKSAERIRHWRMRSISEGPSAWSMLRTSRYRKTRGSPARRH